MKKFIFQPIEPFFINQKFGENLICIDKATGSRIISCDGNNPPAGYKSLYGPLGHKGVDLRTYHGQPVYAAASGRVSKIDTDPKSGLDVRITFEFEGKVYQYINEHLLGYQVREGQDVRVGDCIGWADNTGYSSGDHLHFEIQEWRNGKWISIDPLLVMEPISALKYAGLWRQVKELAAKIAELIADWGHR
jgi:murein DD-endopeptidase MepM/ murein hydrolase activator NlpD